MSYSNADARRVAHRATADALMPGMNEACDTAIKAAMDFAVALTEIRDANNAAIAHPLMRLETAVSMAEMRIEQIRQVIDDAGPDYVVRLLTRLDNAASLIRLAMAKQ